MWLEYSFLLVYFTLWEKVFVPFIFIWVGKRENQNYLICYSALCTHTVCAGFKQVIVQSHFVVSLQRLQRWSLIAKIPNFGKSLISSWGGLFPHAEGLGRLLRYLHRTATVSLEIGTSAPDTTTLELGTTNNMKEIGLDRAALTLLLSCSLRITGWSCQGFHILLQQLVFLAWIILALLTSTKKQISLCS